MKIIWRLVLLSLALLLPTSLHAFKPNGKGHGGITRDALYSISFTINGETLKFTAPAIEEIKAANYHVDKSTDFATHAAHFDNELFFDSEDRIRYLKEDTIIKATLGDGKAARESLGGALHTIQDFFAHSNQAELPPIPWTPG